MSARQLTDRIAPTRSRARAAVAALAWLALAAVGCDPDAKLVPGGPSGAGATTGDASATAAAATVVPDGILAGEAAGPANETARGLLNRLAANYQTASSYSDEGRLVLWAVSGGKASSEVIAPFFCEYAKPNRFRLKCYDAEAACDGRELLARIGAYPDQMLRAEAPTKITPDELLRDPMFAQAVGGRFGVLNPLIGLLFDPDAAKALVFEAGEPKFDRPGTFENHPCWRVRTPTDAGDLVYWIDQERPILRRIELPTADIKSQLDPTVRWSTMALTVDFAKARFDAAIPPERFGLGISQNVYLVNRFIDVTPPEPPSSWLGKPAPDFRLKASNGQELSLRAFQGKTLVIELWATWCPWCVQSLPLVDKAFDKFRENGSVQFLALSVDEPTVKDEALTAALQQLKVTLPWARETDKNFTKSFATVDGDVRLPALVVVDAEGVVQLHEIGFDDELIARLPETINSIRAGKRIAEEALTRYDLKQKEYVQKLLAGAVHDEPTGPVAATVPVAPRREPERFSLRPLFAAPQIQPRGTILALPAEGPKPERIAVVDAWRSVVELAPDGQPIGKFELGLPTESVATILRTAVLADGKRIFAAAAPGQGRAWVYDGDWKQLFAYPSDGSSLGTANVLLTDAERPGDVQLVVGCYGDRGVHGVDLAGRRRWVLGRYEDVAHLAAGPRDAAPRTMLATNKRGTLLAFEPPNDVGRETFVGRTAARPLGVFLRTIRGADLDGDGDPEFAGLAKPDVERELLIGLRADGSETWRVDVPAGAPIEPVEQITTGPLPGGSGDAWVVATADGQLLFIAADGRLVDRFAVGKPLAGVLLTRLGGKIALVVSSVDAQKRPLLEAFELRAKGG